MHRSDRLAVGLALVLAACAHDVTSPEPTLSAASPDLVCNGAAVSTADGRTAVTLTGTHFTPMPSNVLAEPTRMLLPRVTLTPRAAIPGGALATAPIELADDPAVDPAAHTIEFIVDGRVVATSHAAAARHPIPPAPGYVRAVVTRTDGAKAWVQPARR